MLLLLHVREHHVAMAAAKMLIWTPYGGALQLRLEPLRESGLSVS